MRSITMREQIAYQVVFAAIGLFVLLPLWSLVLMAFDGSIRGWPTEITLLPKQFTLDVFRKVWEQPAQTRSFLGLLRNSLIASGGAMVGAVALGTSMAYAFARFRFPCK